MDTKSIARKVGLGAAAALNTPAKRLTLMVGVAASCAVTAFAAPPVRVSAYRVYSGGFIVDCNPGDIVAGYSAPYQYCCPGSPYVSGAPPATFQYYSEGTCYYLS